ncbi:TniQ protein [Azospirillum baldaniorum]|uniref:TniQ family protein n=1 Tax=Azospirillum baldaniorum TaxID=1064539 RepID=UPI00119E0F15|nr:TniQ family protein [Azospirillum baldaniorum]TWA66681.1 TniQ protein [Azospirillum baldaniorum]
MLPIANEFWPGRPTHLEGESFSSWFTRVAAANGLRPAELYRIVQPGGDRNPRDLDRYADIHLLSMMSDKTGTSAEALEHSTFRRWSGMAYERDDGLVKFDWLPPAGREKAKRCFGQQLCPLCLAEDTVPFLRLEWRLSFITVCPKHQRLLLDRCLACNEPFSVLRQDRHGGIFCWSCGADARGFVGDAPPVDPVPVQDDLLNTLSQGWRGLGSYGPVYSFTALRILAIITRLIAGGRHAYALREWIANREPRFALPPENLPRVRDGALLTSRARSVLVGMAHYLLEDWPHRFVAASQYVGMSSRDVRKRVDGAYPFAYADAVEWNLTEPLIGSTRDEVLAAKEVLRRRGHSATYQKLKDLRGGKSRTMGELADPASEGAAWGQGRYWKLDGVSAEVKEAARLAAHRSGESVAVWLDRLVRKELNIPSMRVF